MPDHAKIYQDIDSLEKDPALSPWLDAYQHCHPPQDLNDQIFRATAPYLPTPATYSLTPSPQPLGLPQLLRIAAVLALTLLGIAPFLKSPQPNPSHPDPALAVEQAQMEQLFAQATTQIQALRLHQIPAGQTALSDPVLDLNTQATAPKITPDPITAEPDDLAYIADDFSQELEQLLRSKQPSDL